MTMDANSTPSESVAAREVIITRVYDAPARLLFLAYSKPEHVMKWFGPKGWPLTKCEMDFRVGGEFHFQMTGPENEPGPPFGGKYLEIVPDRKISYDNGFEEPGAGRFVVTVVFEERNGKTTLTITSVFDTIAMKEEFVGLGFVEGSNSGFDNLGDLVAGWKAEGRS
jgi:uncharacterized protein YndB with AHSA1/START domain